MLECGYSAGATFDVASWVSQPLLPAIRLSAASLGLIGQRVIGMCPGFPSWIWGRGLRWLCHAGLLAGHP